MARRKKSEDPEAEGSVEASGSTATLDPPATGDPPEALRTRPAASFAANSDRGTRIEVAVWSKLVTVSPTEEYTQYTLTVSRSWRDKAGNWFGNACFRVHDVPVLLYLVGRAYDWCVNERTTIRLESGDDRPAE